MKSIDPVQLQRIVDEEESHRRLSTQETGSIITGKKVLFAVASYGTSQFLFLQDMLESIRDLCEYGTSVSVVIYSTLPFTPSTLNLLNSRLQCRNPNGNIDAKVIIAGAQLKEHFVDAHRKYFYDHLDDYDLFVYTEDDQNLRPTHFISYLEETQKLKKVVGPEEFANYGIGFIRYERDQKTRQHVVWEEKDKAIRIVNEPKLRGKYGTVRMPHQGMYMATREQLIRWRDRCRFDEIDPENEEPVWLEKYGESLNREFVSSLRLFSSELSEKGCQVKQVFPLKSFEDFMIHHMSDRYHTIPFWEKYAMTSLDIQKLRYEQMPFNDKVFVDEKGKYNGITMEKDHNSLHWEESDEEMKKYLVEIDRWMSKYENYADAKGVLEYD